MSAVLIRESGRLDLGIEVLGALHRDFTLRPATLADTYAAAAVVAVPEGVAENAPAQIAYRMAIEDAVVLFQLESLEGLDPVPSVEALIAAIDPDDMQILRTAAARLKKNLIASRQSSPPGAAPSSSSSEPVTA